MWSVIRCLGKVGVMLQLDVATVPKIVISCCVLHDMCIVKRLHLHILEQILRNVDANDVEKAVLQFREPAENDSS